MIKGLQQGGRLVLSNTRAQFRIFGNPNVLAIASEKDEMLTELVRVLLRSYTDFEDECYSYYYNN
ncbi:MAG: hypothetical protein V1913_15530 [Fibrobacterota bacterium]